MTESDDSGPDKFTPDESAFEDFAVAGVQCPHCNLGSILGIEDPEHEIDGEGREIMLMLPPEETGLLDELEQLADEYRNSEDNEPALSGREMAKKHAADLESLIADYRGENNDR